MINDYPLFEVNQPIGTFYISVIDAQTLIKVTEVKHRGEYPDAVQRDLSKRRVKEIAKYCSDPDATFPTSIVISLNFDSGCIFDFENNRISIDTDKIIGEVIDGQHRINGLKESGLANKFSLPVVFMVDLDAYQKAYVFSIINSKQAPVSSSLIYDLFALSKNRSPFKTCHEITRALNRSEISPFYNRLKMLGKKESGQKMATISQGTFVKYLLELISKDPEEDTRDIKNQIALEKDERCSLRFLFLRDNDEIILKIIINIFNAVRKNFQEEWENPQLSILSKPIGVGAVLKLANTKLIPDGFQIGDVSEEYFYEKFKIIKKYFIDKSYKISSEKYGSNEQARSMLVNDMLEAIEKENPL